MAQDLLSIYQPDGPMPTPEQLGPVMRGVTAVVEAMKTSGAWVFNAGLHPPSTATVVQFKAGDTLMTDGPFAEGKEHVGGFVIVDAADLDEALSWAGRLARALTLDGREQSGGLHVEVRPIAH